MAYNVNVGETDGNGTGVNPYFTKPDEQYWVGGYHDASYTLWKLEERMHVLEINWAILDSYEKNLCFLITIIKNNSYLIDLLFDQTKKIEETMESFKGNNKVPFSDDLFDFSKVVGKGSKLEKLKNQVDDFIIYLNKIGIQIDKLQSYIAPFLERTSEGINYWKGVKNNCRNTLNEYYGYDL